MKRVFTSLTSEKGSSPYRWVISLWDGNTRIGYLSTVYGGRPTYYAYSYTDPMNFAKFHKSERDARQYLNYVMQVIDRIYIEENRQYDCANYYKGSWTMLQDGKIVDQFADIHMKIEEG